MVSLEPIAQPDAAPLRSSAEFDGAEAELKAAFIEVLEAMIRPGERVLNLYGMPHLGGGDALERHLKAEGLAMVRRSDSAMQFLLKSWRGRNPRRGTNFIERYLQTVFPNDWTCRQLWQPIQSAAQYPNGVAPDGDPETHFLTSRVRVGVDVSAVNNQELTVMARALRTAAPARLVLEVLPEQRLGNEYGLANAMHQVIPVYATGTLY